MADQGLVTLITEQDYKQATSEGLSLVDFYADWCGPCRMLSPIIEELAKEMPEWKFLKVDVEKAQNTARELGIMHLPTLVILKDGQEVERIEGLDDKDSLKEKLGRHTS